MRKIILSILFIIIAWGLFPQSVYGQEEIIVNAEVVEAGDLIEEDGIRTQKISCEIQQGDYKGTIREISVPMSDVFLRPISVGDKIKVAIISLDDEDYFQFYDFNRSYNFVWLFVLFLVVLLVFFGWRGIKTLIPTLVLLLLLLVGILPDFLTRGWLLSGSFITIAIVTSLTAWFRLRNKALTIIVVFSVLLCLLTGFLVFTGYSQSSYIYPYVGFISGVNSDLYEKVLDLTLISSVFVPAGAVINASIQIAKYLFEEFDGEFELKEMLKGGIRLSQKVSSGELNNLFIIMLGTSLASIFLIKNHFEQQSYWDNGWIALQVVLTISAGLSILLISPITVFITAGVLGMTKAKTKRGSQRRFKIKPSKK